MSVEARSSGVRQLDIDQALATAQEKVWGLISAHPGEVPIYTQAGRWHFNQDSWAPLWSGGFLAGMIWIFAERTGDAAWREQAEKYSRILEPRKLDTGTHDLGFIFVPSWGRWHAIDPTEETREVLIQAGRTLAKRFNTRGRYLSTWVNPGSTFIDIMPNIEIIYLAASLSGDTTLSDIANAHAQTTRRYLVRGDASTVHEGWFDPETGEFLRSATHQGYRSDSSWVRGQAWAMHGFGSAYRWTHEINFLDTARRCADLYISQVGDSFVGTNDWDDPAPEFPYEASAASIAASAMLQLAKLDADNSKRYTDYARNILARLSDSEFFGVSGDGWEGIIRHAIYHRRQNIGVDESIMWGDYYFVEALHQLSQLGAEDSAAL